MSYSLCPQGKPLCGKSPCGQQITKCSQGEAIVRRDQWLAGKMPDESCAYCLPSWQIAREWRGL